MLGTSEHLGSGLWYFPRVFANHHDYHTVKNCYRESAAPWQMLTPNKIQSMPNQYGILNSVGNMLVPWVQEVTGFKNLSVLGTDVFIDLPGHELQWHFDHDNYLCLLQVYTGDKEIPAGGTQWYIGEQNHALHAGYGTNSIVPKQGLEITETKYVPGAGYINDNTQKKAHGTNRVLPGNVRESVLFTFG